MGEIPSCVPVRFDSLRDVCDQDLGTWVQGYLSSSFSSPALLSSLLPIFAPGPQQVCVLGLHLAKELCEVDEDGDSWLQVTRRLPILPTLFTTLEVSLRMKQNLHFTEAAFHLLLTLARTQQVGGKPEGRREPACLCWVGSGTAYDSPRSSHLA